VIVAVDLLALGNAPGTDHLDVVVHQRAGAGGVIRREYRIAAGMLLISDTHSYDHLSILLSGQAVLKCDGEIRTLTAPCMVEIKAGVEHALYAVTECLWDCIHALNLAEAADADGNRFALLGLK
jgi:quercetin dioxygenase-like cupin family protein